MTEITEAAGGKAPLGDSDPQGPAVVWGQHPGPEARKGEFGLRATDIDSISKEKK